MRTERGKEPLPTVPLLVVAGPTASGKTALAVALARRFHGEVVCADSMQVYRELSVSTARPTEEEMQGVPHHLQGHVSFSETYSVARYADEARRVVEDIHSRGKLSILCGGTGLYISAVTDHLVFERQESEQVKKIRSALREQWRKLGDRGMWNRLREVDPDLAERLPVHDRGRILRALEVYALTGHRMSEQRQIRRSRQNPYSVCYLLLDVRDRETLYRRIDDRVDEMLGHGLLEECARVIRLHGDTAEQAIGCKELRPYFDGECTLSEAVDDMKRRTRQYAKRQLSWFHRVKEAHPLYVDDYRCADDLALAAADIWTRFAASNCPPPG